MAFSKAMPEAFRVTLFNGNRDNVEAKSHAYYTQSERCTITCKTTLCYFIVSCAYLQNLASCAAFAICNHLNSCRENTNTIRVALQFIIVTTAIEKCDTKSFGHGFTW